MADAPPAPAAPAESRIEITSGLEGHDEDVEALMGLFEELQLSAADIANPELDLLTFVHLAHFAGVITKTPTPPPPAPASPEKDEDPAPARKVSKKGKGKKKQAPVGRAVGNGGDIPVDKEGIRNVGGVAVTSGNDSLKNSQERSFDNNSNPYATMPLPPIPVSTSNNGLSRGERAQVVSVWNAGGSALEGSALTFDAEPVQGVIDNSMDDDLDEWWGRADSAMDAPFVAEPSTSNWTTGPTFTTHPPQRWSGWDAMSKRNQKPIVGLVYLCNPQDKVDYLRTGELNIGIIIDKAYRENGYALEVVKKVVDSAFEDKNCYRVQAVLVDGVYKHKAMSLFLKAGFGHEGTRRRAFRSPYTGEFKDVTYLGILATDWCIRRPSESGASHFKIAPASRWDELFARHQREREELLQWEERNLKRSCSTETIRELILKEEEAELASGLVSRASSVAPDVSSSASQSDASQSGGKGKKKKAKAKRQRFEENKKSGAWVDLKLSDLEHLETTGRVAGGVAPAPVTPLDMGVVRGGSPAPSDFSELDAGSEISFSSSLSSQWDVLSDAEDPDLNYQTLSLSSDSEDMEII